MSLFKKKPTHFELEDFININLREITDFLDLCDFVEEENERVLRDNTNAALTILVKDNEGKEYKRLNLTFPLEKNDVEAVLSSLNETNTKPVKSSNKQLKKEEAAIETKQPEELNNVKVSKNYKRKLSFNVNMIKIGVVTIAILLVVTVGMFLLPNFTQPKYEALIQTEEYIKAATIYPEKKTEIEAKIFDKGQEGIKTLETYVKDIDSPGAKLDLAYLKQDFKEVVELKEYADTAIRKTALAVSYVKLGMTDEAYELNQELGSNRLKQLIVDSYEKEAVEALKNLNVEKAEKIQSRIHLLTLQQKIEAISAAIKEEQTLKSKINDTSATKEQKESAEKQIKEVQEKLEKFKKGVF